MFSNKYYPDYTKLYPGEQLTPDVIKALRQSDRTMKLYEYDLKHGEPVYVNVFTGDICDSLDSDATITDTQPSREISLEMLLENNEKDTVEAMNEYANPLTILLKKELYGELHRCISLLNPAEQRLIYALFWEEKTETEYAKSIGRTQSSVNDMKHRILNKLRNSFWKN